MIECSFSKYVVVGSSNINEVIRPVFVFFCDKISQVEKSIFLINIDLKSI